MLPPPHNTVLSFLTLLRPFFGVRNKKCISAFAVAVNAVKCFILHFVSTRQKFGNFLRKYHAQRNYKCLLLPMFFVATKLQLIKSLHCFSLHQLSKSMSFIHDSTRPQDLIIDIFSKMFSVFNTPLHACIVFLTHYGAANFHEISITWLKLRHVEMYLFLLLFYPVEVNHSTCHSVVVPGLKTLELCFLWYDAWSISAPWVTYIVLQQNATFAGNIRGIVGESK